MAIGLSTGAANLLLDSGIGAAFDGSNDIIEIRDGTRPASADDAPTGTVLAEFTLSADSFAAASGGAIVGDTPWTEASADATGVATWFRLKQSTDGGGSSGSIGSPPWAKAVVVNASTRARIKNMFNVIRFILKSSLFTVV